MKKFVKKKICLSDDLELVPTSFARRFDNCSFRVSLNMTFSVYQIDYSHSVISVKMVLLLIFEKI